MHACKQCGGSIGDAFRYCPWCAAPQRTKLVEFFTGTGTESAKALRVSRYTDEGHVRFSVWDESGVAEAAVSLDEYEAGRLARFLRPSTRPVSLLDAARRAAGRRRPRRHSQTV
jgi:hypothetical protein